MLDTISISDSSYISQFEHYGKMTLHYRNKIIGMLPEVARRKLYLQRGCSSLYEYAKKVAGLSEEQVSLALNLRERLQDKPALKQLFEAGTVSVNKLSRVMSIATVENQEELAESVQVMSVEALKVLVRDVRSETSQYTGEAKSLDVHKPESKSLFAQDREGVASATNEFGLNERVMQKLREFKEKGIDINETLMKFLEQREMDVAREKQEVAASLPEVSGRYIPKRVKEVIKKEYGTKCAIPHCAKPSKDIHHTARYLLSKSHNPFLLAPLCKPHHEIAHAIDVAVQRHKQVALEHEESGYEKK